jgi:antitoxin component of RelBE/YafQ-DinJ toxin-antitoxin module
MKKSNKIKMINIRVDNDLDEKFRNHCKKNGYSISKRIRVLLEKDINDE